MVGLPFTNPFDVAKVRMQLQGEAGAAGGGGKRGLIGVLRHLATTEGVRGLERGLVTALFRGGSKVGIVCV